MNQAQHQYCNSDNRPGIIELSIWERIDLDISMAHPWSIDILAKASLFDGAAALRREEIKSQKVHEKFLRQESSPSDVPILFKHLGH